MFVEINLNQSGKGSYLALLDAEGGYWLSELDLKGLGLSLPEMPTVHFEGSTYHSLEDVPGIQYEFDLASITLNIQIDSALLPKKNLDIQTPHLKKVHRPQDNSFLLNYAIRHSSITNPDLSETSLTNELGWRYNNALLLGDTIYRNNDLENSFRRLMTRVILDDRETLIRTTLGDQTFSTGLLGGQGILSGAGYEKLYSMEPNIKKYPGVFYTGVADTPSDVEVYLDGNRIHQERVEPGVFEIRNLNRFGGAGDLEIIIRDSFGREKRQTIPFYIEEQLLKDGQHEYSYHAGLLRENFATEDDSYEDFALSMKHDYGLNRNWTIGVRSEAGDSIYNFAPRVLWNTQKTGALELLVAGSLNEGNNGYALALSHKYRSRYFSTFLSTRNFSEDYAYLATGLTTNRLKTTAELGIGFATKTLGSINLNTLYQTTYSDEDIKTYTLSISRQLTKNVRISGSVNHKDLSGDTTSDFYVGITYTPKPEHLLLAITESRNEQNSNTLVWQKNTPQGEGLGYRLETATAERGEENLTVLNSSGQYNMRYTSIRGDYEWENGDAEDRHELVASIAGGIAILGGNTYLTRPIRDSFALIKVGELEGVKVYSNSQLIGRTSETGTILSSTLNSFYSNRISIDDQDIPIDFSLPAIEKFVSPPYRSGSCFVFNTRKFQPVTGKLFLQKDGTPPIALENLQFKLSRDGEEQVIESGKGGEFYFEPGVDASDESEGNCATLAKIQTSNEIVSSYTATFNYHDTQYTFMLDIPESDELFIDMGDVIVDSKLQRNIGN